ncbi:MAG: CarD family transcriptional regulator [Bacillota bacterium]|nr:CarD family transcriptional regulator [Bacillota bacterium]
MYQIGDKVVYPMHGAGVIEAIEERVVLGEKHQYYTMRMPVGDMKVMIPLSNVKEIGLRDIIDSKKADEVLEYLSEYQSEENANWNKRYRENMVKMKTGDIFEVAAVVKMLMCRDRSKGLSTGERKMLSNAKHILISELVLAKDMKHDEIEEIVTQKIFMKEA